MNPPVPIYFFLSNLKELDNKWKHYSFKRKMTYISNLKIQINYLRSRQNDFN